MGDVLSAEYYLAGASDGEVTAETRDSIDTSVDIVDDGLETNRMDATAIGSVEDSKLARGT